MSTETRNHETYTVKVEVIGSKPWVATIKAGRPEYEMVQHWRVEVLDRETGQIGVGGAYGHMDDAFSVGNGVYRAMRAGYTVW